MGWQDDPIESNGNWEQDEVIDLKKNAAYDVADYITNLPATKASAAAIARNVPIDQRDNILDAVYELGSQKGTMQKTGFLRKVAASAYTGAMNLTEAGLRLTGLERMDEDQQKFARRLYATQTKIDPLRNPDAPWYDPREWVYSAAEMAPTLYAAGGVGKAAGAAAKVAGAGARLVGYAGQAGTAAAFTPEIYDNTLDSLLEQGVSPSTARWSATASAGLQSILFAGLPKKLIPSGGAKVFSKELADTVAKKYAKTVLVDGPSIMAGAHAIDEAIQDYATGKPKEFQEYLYNAGETYKKSIGPMAALAAPRAITEVTPTGREITPYSIKQERIKREIIDFADSGKIPSRTQWKEWGLPVYQGRSESTRLENAKKLAEQYRQEQQVKETEITNQPGHDEFINIIKEGQKEIAAKQPKTIEQFQEDFRANAHPAIRLRTGEIFEAENRGHHIDAVYNARQEGKTSEDIANSESGWTYKGNFITENELMYGRKGESWPTSERVQEGEFPPSIEAKAKKEGWVKPELTEEDKAILEASKPLKTFTKEKSAELPDDLGGIKPPEQQAKDINGEPQRKVYASAIPAMLPSADLHPMFKNAVEQIGDMLGTSHLPRLSRVGEPVRNAAFTHAFAISATKPIVDDLLLKVLGNKWQDIALRKKFADTLNADNVLGIYDQIVQSKPTLEEGSKAGKKLATKQDLLKLDELVRENLKDPEIIQAINKWKEVINPYLNELYNKIKAVDLDTPREGRGRYTDARVNLLTTERAELWNKFRQNSVINPMPETVAANYRNPDIKRDIYMRKATGTGIYSNDLEMILTAVVGPRYNQSSKLDLYDSLVKSDVAVYEIKTPDFKPPEGYKRLPVDLPQTDPETGVTRMNERGALWIRPDLVNEVRNVLNTDMRGNPTWWAQGLTAVQMMSQIDAVSHTLNVWRVITNQLGTTSTGADLVRKIPFVGGFDAIGRMVETASDVLQQKPWTIERKAELARIGALRPAYATRMPGAKFIHYLDTAARLVSDQFYTNLVERGLAPDTANSRRDFINQMGVYNRRVMGNWERSLRDIGISPFIVAGKTMNRVSVRILTGNPGFQATSLNATTKIRALQFSKLLLIPLSTGIPNLLMWGNPMGRTGTPLGAIDMGDDENGRRKILNVWQVEGLARAMRLLGIKSLIEGIQQGKNANQIIGNMIVDSSRTFFHPYFGPAISFGFKAMTGKQLDVRGQMEAARIPGGGVAQYIENARAAAEAHNPLMYGVGRSFLRIFGAPVSGTHGEDWEKALTKQALVSYGYTTMARPSTAAEQMAHDLLVEKLGSGLTEEEKKKLETKTPIIRQIKTSGITPEIRKQITDAVQSGTLNLREAKNILKQSKMSDLQWNARMLNTKDLNRVWKNATLEEKGILMKIIFPRQIKRQSPEDRALLLEMSREYRDMSNKKNLKKAS